MKIVINTCWGGFTLSKEATELYKQKTNINVDVEKLISYEIPRNDPVLIEIVETLGDNASTKGSKLQVVQIPDDATDWRIEEYDGWEHIAEGRRWP